jgi:DNA-binding transcriptional regulator GbsR (MarR family)
MAEISQNLVDVENSMIDGLGQLADYFGFSKVMGQLYGVLLLSPEPLSLDDLMEKLSISKASVSTNLRTLEHMGMVRQAWVKGGSGRRKYYESETDFWQIITNILSGREMRDVERALSIMEKNNQKLSKSMKDMSAEDQELASLYIDRISQIEGLFRFAQLVITSVLSQGNEMDFEDISALDLK